MEIQEGEFFYSTESKLPVCDGQTEEEKRTSCSGFMRASVTRVPFLLWLRLSVFAMAADVFVSVVRMMHIRDDKGQFIATANQRMEGCPNASVAEAMAMRLGLELAQMAGCNRLVAHSDNMDVIEAMNQGGRSASLGAAIFDDCFFLSNDYAKISFAHCPREANAVTHELARLAKFSPPAVWLEYPPNSIAPLLISDVNVISNE